jgi:very-short-patch-repair endonuclease
MVQGRDTVPVRVEVATTTGRTRTLRGTSPALRRTRINVRKRQFDQSDVREKYGIEIASPVLALIEFAAEASEREVRFAFLEACRLKLFNRRDVRDCHDHLTGTRGATKLRPLLALWVPQLERIKSVFEGRILLGLIERRLPLPEVNVKVGGYEVDFLWRKHGVALEADGETYHSDPPQRAIDAAKQRDLEQHGLEVMRVTSRQFDRDPDAILDEVANKLASRAVDSGLFSE